MRYAEIPIMRQCFETTCPQGIFFEKTPCLYLLQGSVRTRFRVSIIVCGFGKG